MNDLKNKWADMSIGQRAGIVVTLVLLLIFLLKDLFSGPPSPMPTAGHQAKLDTVNLGRSSGVRSETVETLMANISSLERRLDKLDRQVGDLTDLKGAILALKDRVERQQKESGRWHLQEILEEVRKTNRRLDDLEKRQFELEEKVRSGQLAMVEDAQQSTEGENALKHEAESESPVQRIPEPTPKLRVIGPSEQEAEVVEKEDEELEGYISRILAGGMFEGVMLTGMDAPTSTVAKQNPIPVLIRVKTDAYLPNQYQSPIQECFVVASGYGVLSTERAEIRTEKLSCVTEDGRTIEKKLDGYVVGEDGKSGVRGRLVSKQGQLIARSLIAGFLEGFSKSLKPNVVSQLNINPAATQQFQDPNVQDVARAGVYSGMSNAAHTVAQFYLDLAKETFPVVEVDAGRRVTVVLLSGVDVVPEKEQE